MPFVAGTQLGRYIIRSLLGKGGMGEVYLAEDRKLGRLVALKTLPGGSSVVTLRRFFKEARAASTLSHPNVAHIYEIEELNGINFIALEYIAGETLRSRLHRKQLSISEAVDITLQVAGALAAAHNSNVVHRDIKPENIMLGPEGLVKVLDFGLAKVSEAEERDDNATFSLAISQPGVLRGTVSYMSPEQARGLEVDSRTDIWSLGCLLFEMIAGRVPFEGATSSDIIAAILNQQLPPLSRFSTDVTADVESIVSKALAKNREERYQTIVEMRDDLRRVKRRLDTESETQDSPSTDQARKTLSGESKRSTENIGPVPSGSSVEYLVNTIQRHRKSSLVVLGFLILLVSASGYVAFNVLKTEQVEQRPRPLRRATFDSGLQNNPSWSPDGRYIAYSADTGGNFDIWVMSTNGGDAIRLTDSPSHDWQPDWSPDGNSIVFRSERDGGGLYTVPAPFGGQVRKICAFGYDPRWSPDGTQILFFNVGMRLYERPKVYLLALDGSSPRQILASLQGYEQGIKRGALDWYPDGKKVSYWGDDKILWTIPVDGGPNIHSEISDSVAQQIREAGLELETFRWAPTGKALYLEARSQGVLNLWRVNVDPQTLRWTHGLERLTVGDGQDTEVNVSRDGKKIAYTKLNQSTSIWQFPFDANRGRIKDDGGPITRPDVDAWFPDVSRDGKKILFTVYKQGMVKQELWEKSLEDSVEKKLRDVEGAIPFCPRWSPDGSRIAFTRLEPINPNETKKAGSILLLSTADGSEHQFTSRPISDTETWRDYVYDWSADGRWILGSSDRLTPQRWMIVMFPVADAPHAEKNMRIILKDPSASLWATRLSPDEKWICYLRQEQDTEESYSVLYVVPATGGDPIRITGEKSWADKPRWSPDGKTIYFISNERSYFLNVWGIRFDPASARPVGEPFQITHFGSPSQMISTRLSYMEMAVSPNRLWLPINKVSGSIWILENL